MTSPGFTAERSLYLSLQNYCTISSSVHTEMPAHTHKVWSTADHYYSYDSLVSFAVRCPPGLTDCGGVCVNTDTDSSNCGSCNNPCNAGQKCSSGYCTCTLDSCPGGLICNVVTGSCENCSSNSECRFGMVCIGGLCNCGSLNNTCNPGEDCINGMCKPRCPPERPFRCGPQGMCVDFLSDSLNCGSCNNQCNPGEHCINGMCTRCPPERPFRCGPQGMCVDFLSDSLNCGSCNHRCEIVGQSCVNGRCECMEGEEPCEDLTSHIQICTNTRDSIFNCGSCGRVCCLNQRCENGECAPDGLVICGGVCVNTDTDSSNCGSCGNVCGPGKQCIYGTCDCPVDLTDCGGVCVNTDTDPNYCGGCYNRCPQGANCVNRQCQCPAGEVVRDGRCVPEGTCRACNNNDDCPAHTACSRGECWTAYEYGGARLGACARPPFSDDPYHSCYEGAFAAPDNHPVCIKPYGGPNCGQRVPCN
jgi:Stigma-specific protein, Stig1